MRQWQLQHNLETDQHWELFAQHRWHVMQALLDDSPSKVGYSADSQSAAARCACILGAGNCNDIDLGRLLESFEHIMLVDCDSDALSRGCHRQLNSAPERQRCELVEEDLSGWLASHSRQIAPYSETKLIRERFHLVASTCVLTQMFDSISHALAEDQQAAIDTIVAVRLRHLQHMLHLLAEGGRGVLFSDVVSSASWPELVHVSDAELNVALAAQIRRQNFFTGANPSVIYNLLRSHPMLCNQLERLKPLGPWRWNLGPRIYAVVGFSFYKRREEC